MIFKTDLRLASGDFERLFLFLKMPPSDLRQKIRHLSSSFPFIEIPERWSTIYKFDIPLQEFKLASESSTRGMFIRSEFDIELIPDPYHFSTNVRLNDLDDIWQDKMHVTDYLKPADNVESDAPEIVKAANEIVGNNLYFWSTVQQLANWVNLHIVYDNALRDLPNQGALGTLRRRKAICADFVHLFLALTRALNIPSRAVIGLSRQKLSARWDSHSWTEIHDPQYGWTPIDVVTQPMRLGNLGRDYIKRSIGYNCDDRLYAFYTEPSDLPEPIDLSVIQEVIIEDQIIQIPLDYRQNS